MIAAQEAQGDSAALKTTKKPMRLPRPTPISGGMTEKDNLNAVLRDCKAIRLAGSKYGFVDAGEENMYIMEVDPIES